MEDDMTISRLVGIAISAVLLIGTAEFAQAAYPCGPGFTLQDGFCKPYRGPHMRYGGYYAGPYGYAYSHPYRRHHHRHYYDYR